jgi:PBSX family phage terminase large subunit
MIDFWGTDRVTPIRADNTADLFGERCYCLGADNARQVNRIRGSTIKYAYGDEITTWNAEVFTMLKSRLDKPWSVFDGTCNPESPSHWFKAFLDSNADIYQQSYTIDDNPTLTPEFVENLKREYAGTVYYDRYILGRWMAAEGIIYRQFADDPERFLLDDADIPPIVEASIGVDFGGGKSAHAFVCVGFTRGMQQLVVLDEYYEKDALTPDQLEKAFCDFAWGCCNRFPVAGCYCDSAEQTLIRGLRTAAARERIGIQIYNAHKKPINDRIRCATRLMATDRFKVRRGCQHAAEAFRTALWDSKHEGEDVRLDDGTTNIDTLDATEYAYERYIPELVMI